MPNEIKKGNKTVIFRCAVFSVGVLLNFSGYLVLIGLQSSINIKDGIGAASVTSAYITASIFSVTFTPILLRLLGAKKSVLFSEFCYLFYILLNYYPAYFTLIPAGVIVGVGEATLWPSLILYYVHFAQSYEQSKTKNSKSYVPEFIGFFYLVYQVSWVFGNILNFSILISGKNSIPNSNYSNSEIDNNLTDNELTVCGKNDCQDPNTTDLNISRYQPGSKTLVFILIGVCAAMVLAAMLIQKLIVSDIALKNDSSTETISNKQKLKTSNKTSLRKSMMLTMKATCTVLLHPKQLMVMPFALYCGLILYFALGEIPRAFGSCIFGVEKVGLIATVIGGTGGFASYFSAKINQRFGRNVTMVVAICMDITYYLMSLLWVPDSSSLWMAYMISIGCGVSNGTWQALVNEIYSAYFSDNLEIAMPIWNMFVLIGIAWQSGWSTSLCINQKIHFHLGFLCFSIFCYCISQCVYYRGRKSHSNQCADTESL